MRRTPIALAFAGATLLSGCRVESALNPTDNVVVKGSALNEDKSPIFGEVKLYRDSTSTCLIPGEFATLQTDSMGAFTKQLTGAETQINNVARCFRIALPASDKGARVSAEFLMQVKEMEIPTLQRWTGKVAVTPSGDGAEFTFAPLTQTHSGFTGVGYTAQVTTNGLVAWSKSGATSPVTFDKYMLEDFASANAMAWSSPDYKASGTTFKFYLQTESLALPQKALVPVSRGATCAYNKAPTTCPLTDGKVEPALLENVSELTVTLAEAKTVKKVVLRGFRAPSATTLVLEGSNDGTQFTQVASLGLGDYQVADVSANTPYSRYRLKASRNDSSAVTILELTELSLFE